MKELTYEEAGEVLGVHPYHVRRIVRRYPNIIQPVVYGYNNIKFRLDQVKRVKVQRQRDAVKSLGRMRRKISKLRRAA